MCKGGKNLNFGNFRDRMEWSNTATKYGFTADNDRMIDKVETALVHDVYLSLQPYQMALYNRNSKSFFAAMRDEIHSILAQYGPRDILFITRHDTMPPSLARNAMEITSKGVLSPGGAYSAYLVREKCSMSLSAFLLAMAGGEEIPAEIIEEWSGIPEEKQPELYEEIVEFIRRHLTDAHNNHAVVAFSASS